MSHKITDNHSKRSRRSSVSHYLNAQAEWGNGTSQIRPAIRGKTFPGKIEGVELDVLLIVALATDPKFL